MSRGREAGDMSVSLPAKHKVPFIRIVHVVKIILIAKSGTVIQNE